MPAKMPSKHISRKPAAKSDEHRSLYLSYLKFAEVWDLADMDAVMKQVGQGGASD